MIGQLNGRKTKNDDYERDGVRIKRSMILWNGMDHDDDDDDDNDD